MSALTVEQIAQEISVHMETIAKQRDALDAFIDDLTMLKEDCAEAYDSLLYARDALSRMV